MKTPLRRRSALAVLTVLVPVLTSCGFGYQTDQVYQPSKGVNNRDSQVDVLNALIVSANDGSGTLVTSLVNNDLTRPDALIGAKGDGVTFTAAKVPVPADGLVNLATTEPIITVTGEKVTTGSFVRLVLSFENSDDVEVNVPVVEHSGDYASVPVKGPADEDKATAEEEAAN